ncbi:DUF6543 domain-containing protein [Pseudomonas sp. W2-17]|uniref:dermonecrotic toxin domain-containing protein n=1 Tax=Pseudomonas sp. W2-17 TaxID=3058039 RepID=UPI0034E06611
MTTTDMTPGDLMSTHASLDQTLLEITAPLPEWLLTASDTVLETYREGLTAYHVAAARLEAHLRKVLPSFETFTDNQIAARIKADLGIDIAPETIVIDLPKNVRRDYDIDPQFGRIKSYAAPWVASSEREHLSLGQLARRNFASDDEQMAQRLVLAESELNAAHYIEAGLTASYLHRMIPQLDVAQRYRTLLDAVFRVPGAAPEAGAAYAWADADLLLDPYEHKLLLEGFCEFSRHRLSEAGYQLFQMAALARSRYHTDAAELEMNWVRFKPGVAVTGERDGHTLAGLCVMRDRQTNLTVIYLPDAPGDVTLIEGSSPAQAKSRLIQRLIRDAALVEYLAERTMDRPHQARHVSYINQALARRFEGFIDFAPALDLQLPAQQLHCRAWMLHRQTESDARSQFDLARERSRAQNDGFLMYFTAMLCLLPGVGTLISLPEGLASAHEAVNAFSRGRLDDGLLASGAVALSVLDVALSIVPGAASIRVLTRAGRRSAGIRNAMSAAGSHVLKPFDGYAVQASLAGALPQSGRDLGTVLKDGQLWIQRDGQAYAAYRRPGEHTLRLQKTASQGYEPPVRFEQGEWVYHTDVGLRGGVKSTIAETLIAKAHPDPAFTHRQARQLLDQFEFPSEHQRRLELDLAVHFEKHRALPDWAEAYRRPVAVPDASPQPGPSGVKRKDPPTADNPAKRAPEAGPSTASARLAGPDTWKTWARPMIETDDVRQITQQPPVFRIGETQGSDFIQLDGKRYDILPSGGTQHPSIVLLKNPATLEDSFSGLNETIRRNRFEQPIMASFQEGKWTVHGPLFKRKIQQLVEQARPGMTPTSYRVLAEKIFDRADPGHTGMTSSRLINLRATINAWQHGQPSPMPGLNDPLLMLDGSHLTGQGTLNARLSISYGPSLQRFSRLDFSTQEPSLLHLLTRAAAENRGGMGSRKNLRDYLSALVTHAGYIVVSANEAVLHSRSILLFRRPGQEPLYLLKMTRGSTSMLGFDLRGLDSAIPMSNRWIDEWVTAHPGERAIDAVAQARNDGCLVKLVGGIRVSNSSDSGIQVFVERIANDF